MTKKKKLITSFNIFGHSNYDIKGKDIVCSAISAITQGMFNAIIKMCDSENVSLNLDPNKNIQAKLLVKNLLDNKLQILLKAMYYQFYTVKIQFPKHININTKETT